MANTLTDWLATYFDEVTPQEFYRDLFPQGELDIKDGFTKGKYTAIAVEVTRQKKADGKPKIKRHTITDDLEMITQLTQSENFCLCSPLSYCGKSRTAENARVMYAIAVDLDKVRIKDDGTPQGLIDLWNGHIKRAERIPVPTYIVSSGTGLHLYYIMERGIALYADTAKQLQNLKHELTELIWNEGIVNIRDDREIQQEGIYQGFRMVGTITKLGERVRAFQTGGKVSMEYLNEFVENKVTSHTEYNKLTLKQAKEKFPEWYERRIERKEPKGVWHVSRNLYDWWKREILRKGRVGHRYYCLMTLAMYAQKCSMYDSKHNPNPVTYEELENDCFEIMEFFETLTDNESNHFDESDVMDALESFNERWITYPRESIEYRSGIAIQANKRNGRKQADHIKLMNFVRDELNNNKDWRKGNGRKPKKDIIEKWQQSHPNGTVTECSKALNVSRTTVYKYWKA